MCVCAHLMGWKVVQLDKQQEVDVVSVLCAVCRVNRAERQIVELTELYRKRPLLRSLIGRPGEHKILVRLCTKCNKDIVPKFGLVKQLMC